MKIIKDSAHHSLKLLFWQMVTLLIKVGIILVQGLPVDHVGPELVCQPLLPDRLQLSVLVAVPHGARELLVVHLGVVLDLAPQPGELVRVADAEHALGLVLPRDHARVTGGVPQQRHDPLGDLQTGS